MASCEATSLVTKLWMKRAFKARNSFMVPSDCRSRCASCMFRLLMSSSRQFVGSFGGRVVRRVKAFDLQFLQRSVGRHRQRRKGREESKPQVALAKLHRHDRRGVSLMAWKPPFGRQAGIGHDFVEQLRRHPARLRDLAMQDLDQMAGELFPVDDGLAQAFWMENRMHRVVYGPGFH